jgi:hypothetical protein
MALCFFIAHARFYNRLTFLFLGFFFHLLGDERGLFFRTAATAGLGKMARDVR